MAGFIYFTEEQKRRANEVNLESFLLRQGERLLKSGREKRLASDHSITVRGNQWYDHAIEKGGGAMSLQKENIEFQLIINKYIMLIIMIIMKFTDLILLNVRINILIELIILNC